MSLGTKHGCRRSPSGFGADRGCDRTSCGRPDRSRPTSRSCEARLRDDARVGVLVDNAGAALFGQLAEQSPGAMARLIGLNVRPSPGSRPPSLLGSRPPARARSSTSPRWSARPDTARPCTARPRHSCSTCRRRWPLNWARKASTYSRDRRPQRPAPRSGSDPAAT